MAKAKDDLGALEIPPLDLTQVAEPTRRRLLQATIAGAGTAALGFVPAQAFAAGGELVVALPNNPSTFDPTGQANHDAMVVSQTIFENLIAVDHSGGLEPQLAKALPQITNGGRTYTFELREGISFQNGQPFTAEDVKYSFDYVLDPKNNALRRPLFNRINEVIVEGKHRVRFEMREPYRPFLYYMTKYMGIFPVGSREKHDANYWRSSPIGLGTGPGIFVEWRQNDRVVLRKNPDYWRKGLPGWDRLVVARLSAHGQCAHYQRTQPSRYDPTPQEQGRGDGGAPRSGRLVLPYAEHKSAAVRRRQRSPRTRLHHRSRYVGQEGVLRHGGARHDPCAAR